MPKASKTSSEGRRSEGRVYLDLPITLIIEHPLSGKRNEYPGHLLNVSKAGMAFVLEQPVVLASVAKLEIHPPAPASPFSIKGWLVWEDEKKKIYGIQLFEPHPALLQVIDDATPSNVSEAQRSRDRRQGERRVPAGKLADTTRGDEYRNGKERRTALGRRPKSDLTMFDRRSHLRVSSGLIVRIQIEGQACYQGVLESLSELGLSFYLEALLPAAAVLPITIEFSIGDQRVFPVHMTWHFPLREGYRYGGRFEKLSTGDLQAIRDHLAIALRDPKAVSDRRLRSTIVSELVSYENQQGRKIVGYHDHRAAATYREDPLIVIPSAYAETKKDGLHTAYYLVANGFQVLRYDNTNHTGESDGDILNITLNNFKEDLLAALDYAEFFLRIPKAGVAATSLSARTAMKAAAQDPRISFLLGLVPAVDVRYTLNAVYCEDLIGTFTKGKLWGITNVLGCNTDLDAFLQDAIDSRYHDLRSTLEDAQRLKIPFVLLAAEKDPWVQFDDVKQVMDACPSVEKELHLIPAMHTLKENPKAAQAAFRLIVCAALRYMSGKECRPLNVVEPSFRWLAVQNRIERHRMRLLSSFEKKANQSFWTQYLDQFHFINQLSDYRQLLETLYESVHGVHPGERVLDAGSGNGTFGLWLVTSLALQSKNDRNALKTTLQHPIELTCVDYVPEALAGAEANHQKLQEQLFVDDAKRPVHFQYKVVDLEEALPFPNASFDKVVSNLVISYLKDPIATCRELIRVTKRDGFIVLTTLKPYADTSQIYRNYVQTTPGVEGVERTRKLLNNAGDIRLKETQGHFNFFSEEELLKIAQQAGAIRVRVARVFGDQANMLIIQV
jgi:SAM-dependent methyltransferase/pimeloyl-ACP methyl ester carboxylesterase